MMDKSKLHHYVPRMLLRRFSTESGENPQIHRLDVRTGRIAVSHVRNEAAITHYNRLEQLDIDSPLTVEETLAAVEGQTKPLLDAIVEGGELSFTEMRMLATFVFLQHQRTPRTREWSKFVQDHAARMFAEMGMSNREAVRGFLRKTNPQVTEEEVDRTRAEWLAQIESGEVLVTTGWDGEVAGMFANADTVPIMLMERMQWVVLHAPAGSSFLIGDHPVCVVDPLAGPSRGTAWFSSDEVEVTLPIHRTACLLLQPNAPRLIHTRVGARTVDEVNLRSYAGAEWRSYAENQRILQEVRRTAKQRPELVARLAPRPPHLLVGEVVEGERAPFKTTAYAAPRHATVRRFGQDIARRKPSAEVSRGS